MEDAKSLQSDRQLTPYKECTLLLVIFKTSYKALKVLNLLPNVSFLNINLCNAESYRRGRWEEKK
jgi:hypothetical protein